jgi:hypothetical protein
MGKGQGGDMTARSDKLVKAYRQRFGDDAPGACIYYDTFYGCWMWNHISPQNIGQNFDAAMATIKNSSAMAILLDTNGVIDLFDKEAPSHRTIL